MSSERTSHISPCVSTKMISRRSTNTIRPTAGYASRIPRWASTSSTTPTITGSRSCPGNALTHSKYKECEQFLPVAPKMARDYPCSHSRAHSPTTGTVAIPGGYAVARHGRPNEYYSSNLPTKHSALGYSVGSFRPDGPDCYIL